MTAAIERAQVAVLARAPVPGQAKTRLIPRLGAAAAARLQAALTERALRRARATGADVVLWVAGDSTELAPLAQRHGARLHDQPPGDLGARMLAAVAHARAANRACIVIGTDCPAQSPDDLESAAALLVDHDVVLQPALDGGYVLIALREPWAELFRNVAWGGPTVFETTLQRVQSLSLRCVELRPLPDLDDAHDLQLALDNGWISSTDWNREE